MPLTPFQQTVLRILAKTRSPESYVAGATVIHRAPNSPRFSADVDLFHDPGVSVQACGAVDREALQAAGYSVEILLEQRGIIRAVASKGGDSVKLEWVSDTAFRFFPVIKDEWFGYRLHDVDVAVNKCLALANRTEVRDVIDLLLLHSTTLHLGLCCWAACGKDPGFTPDLLFDLLSRNARITPDLLAAESLRKPIDPRALKSQWSAALHEAREVVTRLLVEPSGETALGCIFVASDGTVPVSITSCAGLHQHFGSVRGCWPQIARD